MTRDEVLRSIDDFATGDNADATLSLRTEISGLYDKLDAADSKAADDAKMIEKLKADNSALYRRITVDTPPETPPEKKDERGIDWDSFFKEAGEGEK